MRRISSRSAAYYVATNVPGSGAIAKGPRADVLVPTHLAQRWHVAGGRRIVSGNHHQHAGRDVTQSLSKSNDRDRAQVTDALHGVKDSRGLGSG